MVKKIFKSGGCVLCFWFRDKKGWNEKHIWERCGYSGEAAVEIVKEIVDTVERGSKD